MAYYCDEWRAGYEALKKEQRGNSFERNCGFNQVTNNTDELNLRKGQVPQAPIFEEE